MANTGKVQGGNQAENLDQKKENETNLIESDKKEGSFPMPNETSGVNPGASGLSSIPGGKSRPTVSGKDVKEMAEGWADQLREGANTFVNRAQEVAGDVAERAKKTANETTENVGSAIRRNPVQALLIGFGVGCLVGILLPFRR